MQINVCACIRHATGELKCRALQVYWNKRAFFAVWKCVVVVSFLKKKKNIFSMYLEFGEELKIKFDFFLCVSNIFFGFKMDFRMMK